MPTVPTYDNFQVASTSEPQARFATSQVDATGARQAQAMGDAAMQAGGDLARMQLDAQREVNTARVNEAANQAVKTATDLQLEAMQLRGKNALERPDNKALPDEYDERLSKALDGIAEGLGNDAQRQAFAKLAAERRQTMRSHLKNHLAKETETYKIDGLKGTIETAQNHATLLYGDETERAKALAAISGAVGELAKMRGWDKETRDNAMVEATSPLHAGILKAMVQGGRGAQAQEYYAANSAGMTLQARAAMQGMLKEAGENERADAAATGAWNALGPKFSNDAVRLFDLEQDVRARLKDNPEAAKKAVAGLRERASAFNAQQAEVKAQAVGSVWKLIDGGTAMRDVARSDAWLALSPTDQHDIRKHLEAEAATRAARAAAESGRQLTEMQRRERMALFRNGEEYLTASDPNVLARMSRAQVEAQRGKFGLEATQHLLAQWDALRKPGKLDEARMDQEDFNMVADKMGLHPFKPRKSEDEAARLGVLKQRVETLISEAQAGGVKLTREAKMDLMRKELSRSVQVEGGWFSGSKAVAPVALTKEQAAKVVVPAAERAKISEALKAMNRRFPNDPRYSPTEDNLRREYLRHVGAPGDLHL